VKWCKACSSEAGCNYIPKSAKILKRCCTFDRSKQKTKVKALASSRMGIVHSSNGKASLPRFPFVSALIPHKLGGKVLIENLMCNFWILLVGFEISHESCVLCSCSVYNLLHCFRMVLIPCDALLVWKVDLKANNIWRGTMHDKVKKMPKGLTGRDKASIKILFDLILACPKLHSNTIMALVDILVDVLQGFDGGDALDIDVAMVLPYQISTVSHNPAIINLLSPDLKCLSSVTVSQTCI